jgi:hypothetical protein
MSVTKVSLFLIFLFGAVTLKAQTNFLKGYYITATQDTIQGYIDYRSEQRNYKVCVFRETLNSKSITIYPQDIVGFAVENKDLYEKHAFLSRTGEEMYGFFKVIVRGNLSLLRYQSRYFAKNSEGDMFEISKRRIVSDGKVREDYYGLGMLVVLMKACDEITGSFLEKEYKSTSNLIHLFKRYNSCIGSSIFESGAIKIKPHLDFAGQVALTASNLSFSSSLEKAKPGTDLSFGFGGFASLFLPRVDERIRLLLEVSYGQYGEYSYFTSGNTVNDLFVDYKYVKTPVFIRYSNNKLFLDIGFQNQFILNEDLKWRVETVQLDNVFTRDGRMIPFNKLSSGLLVGLGIRYKVSNRVIMSSVRFSASRASSHQYKPRFQTLELNISIQLTK